MSGGQAGDIIATMREPRIDRVAAGRMRARTLRAMMAGCALAGVMTFVPPLSSIAWAASEPTPLPQSKPTDGKSSSKPTSGKTAQQAPIPTAKPDPKAKSDAKTKSDAKSAANPIAKPPAKPDLKAKSDSKTTTGSLPKPTAKPTQAAKPAAAPTIGSASPTILTGELGQLRAAVASAKAGRGTEALAQAQQLDDPVARTLVTWLVIRHASGYMTFESINQFLKEKPGWPTQSTLRRRAERVLMSEKKDPATVRAFFAEQPPLSGEGKIALARAMIASGDQGAAIALVREAWRDDDLYESLEGQVMEEFGSVLTRADHKARADRYSYKPDTERALRAAARAGSDVVALTKARLAVARKEGSGQALFNAVPMTLSSDPAYLFAKSQLLRRQDRPKEAAQALLNGAKTQDAAVDPDEWWIERRLVSRELLDAGEIRLAYQVAANGPPPAADNYRAEQHFTAGWIALRFLKDPRLAYQHFARIDDDQKHPITLARAGYWQGRAAEAMGDGGRARSAFESAARYSTNYYGQLARTKLGLSPVALHASPSPSFTARANFARREPIKAVRLLYAIGERDIAMTMLYDLAWRLEDSGELAMLADLTEEQGDARGALVVGKESLAEGHPLDNEAFPGFGLPSYTPIGKPVDKAAIYAVARQESQFNPRTLSSAKAMGLMQVTPAAGQQVAKDTGASYSEARLMSDQSYNVQFGAAELGELVDNYNGNYVLVFAAYNAGRGSVRKWLERYGDPRDPDVDVVDWVESIPFSETRNYVQRVMENYQVYKVRFNIPSKLQMEADLRGGR